MSARAGMAALGLALALASAGPARAQNTPTRDPARVARLELDSAIGLYVTSGLLMTGAGIGLLTGIIAVFDGDTGGSNDVALAAVVGSGVAAPLSLVVLCVAIGLDVDAFFRRRSLREARRSSRGPATSVSRCAGASTGEDEVSRERVGAQAGASGTATLGCASAVMRTRMGPSATRSASASAAPSR